MLCWKKRTAKTKAENAVNNNSETITRLDKEHKELTAECETIKSEISSQLSGYSDNWQTDIDNLLNKLKKDANEYNDHQKQLNDDSTKLESGTTLNNSLLQFSQSILTVCPEWKAEFDAKAYFCRDINREWADLLAEVTRLVSKIKDCKAVITSSTEGLTAYYQESGKTEKDLLMLIAQEPQVATARKFVVDTDSLLKSRNDAIVDAQKLIEVSLKALGLNERTELPDYQSVENEKNGILKASVITGLESFRKILDYAEAGDNVGVLLRGINRDQVERGQVLAKPGSVTPHSKFKGQVYVLTKEEGGRHTAFLSNYRPQFYFRTTDVTGVITLPAGVDMVMPGDNVELTVELIHPIAMEKGTKFSIREGGRTVGAGTVSEIIK